MLVQIRDYLSQQKIASNQQIAREFGLSLDALEPMLTCWIRKKIIEVYEGQKSCLKACFRCKGSNIVYYQFLGFPPSSPAHHSQI